jgi:hypothetical protein
MEANRGGAAPKACAEGMVAGWPDGAYTLAEGSLSHPTGSFTWIIHERTQPVRPSNQVHE